MPSGVDVPGAAASSSTSNLAINVFNVCKSCKGGAKSEIVKCAQCPAIFHKSCAQRLIDRNKVQSSNLNEFICDIHKEKTNLPTMDTLNEEVSRLKVENELLQQDNYKLKLELEDFKNKNKVLVNTSEIGIGKDKEDVAIKIREEFHTLFLEFKNDIKKQINDLSLKIHKSDGNEMEKQKISSVNCDLNYIISENSQLNQTSYASVSKNHNENTTHNSRVNKIKYTDKSMINQRSNNNSEYKKSGKIKIKDPSTANNNVNNNNKNNKQAISADQVSLAMYEAEQLQKTNEILNLREVSAQNNNNNNNNSDWQTVEKRKSRRFVVGHNRDLSHIQTIPKYVSLHVTRLHPKTKPEDLQNVLKEKFSEVECELHNSKHPDKYASMKVTIRQDNFKDAWKRDTWPEGSIVSRFFTKKRMLPQIENQADPLT